MLVSRLKKLTFLWVLLLINITLFPYIGSDYFYEYRAYFYTDLQLQQAALQDLTTAIELNPKNFNSYYYRGLIYLEMHQYDLAAKDFSTIIESKPDYPYSYYFRGHVYHLTEQYDLAAKDLTKFIEICPENEKVYLNKKIASSERSRI